MVSHFFYVTIFLRQPHQALPQQALPQQALPQQALPQQALFKILIQRKAWPTGRVSAKYLRLAFCTAFAFIFASFFAFSSTFEATLAMAAILKAVEQAEKVNHQKAKICPVLLAIVHTT